MTEQVQGPFYLVHLEEDEPWLEAIKQADWTYESDRARCSVAIIKQMPFSGGSTSLESAFGTALTHEVLQLPNGQKLIDDFMAGDTSVRDRHFIPGRGSRRSDYSLSVLSMISLIRSTVSCSCSAAADS